MPGNKTTTTLLLESNNQARTDYSLRDDGKKKVVKNNGATHTDDSSCNKRRMEAWWRHTMTKSTRVGVWFWNTQRNIISISIIIIEREKQVSLCVVITPTPRLSLIQDNNLKIYDFLVYVLTQWTLELFLKGPNLSTMYSWWPGRSRGRRFYTTPALSRPLGKYSDKVRNTHSKVI